jgi:hypothetical protein
MSIFFDQSGNDPWPDCYTISGQDGGLNEAEPGEGSDPTLGSDPALAQLTYDEGAPTQPATDVVLYTLATNTFQYPVIITSLGGGNDPYTGEDITGQGTTYNAVYNSQTAGQINVLRVVYDNSQCNGQGIWALDINKKPIATPTAILLYHELGGHAYNWLTQGHAAGENQDAAITAENVLRSQLGYCLRGIPDEGAGCGGGDTCGGSTGCFIVSAASGLSESAEVVRLKQVRDRVVRSTSLGAQLMDAIYREYYRFSPRIASELQRDPILRKGVLKFAVRPLIAWYSLAEVVSLAPGDAWARKEWGTQAIRACHVGVDPRVVAEAMASIAAGRMPSPEAPAVLGYLGQRVAHVASLKFASWGVIEPLVRVWRSVAACTDLCEEIRAWLAAAPLEALNPPAEEALDVELSLLASASLSRCEDRLTVGSRLAAAWPSARPSLARRGFLDTSSRLS